MKRILFALAIFIGLTTVGYAQNLALIDTEYILKNIPTYEQANKQLEQQSKQWQGELEKVKEQVTALYKKYQEDLVFLTPTQKTQRENEIVEKENSLNELRDKYFGSEGELIKRRKSMIEPIQDEIYNAVKEISKAKGYSLVVDRASAAGIIFASPKLDISNDVLSFLGYLK